MNGNLEIHRRKQRLDSAFTRAERLDADAEILSDFAKYLCVLVSGFLEKSIVEVLLEYSRKHSDPRIQRHIEKRLDRLTNLKAGRLIETMGSFDPRWQVDLESYIVDERKDALDSIVDLRNRIAHGKDAGITMKNLKEYYGRVCDVVKHVSEMCT